MSLATALPVALIRVWQYSFSAVFPPACRFEPSCSAYAIHALRAHGVARGGYLALRRTLRCQPWGGQGHDPVPERH